MFDGGARSGKTSLLCRYIILRAILYPKTRHLIGRVKFNHAKLSVWKQTLIPMLNNLAAEDADLSKRNGSAPHTGWVPNETDHIIYFANGSEIWLGGFDEKDRSAKVFGQEYATIWGNEAHEISYNTFQDLKTRLNWPGMDIKFLFDTNPKHPAHWLYKTFIMGLNFESGSKLFNPDMYGRLHFSPYDNIENLHPDYIKNNLETLTGVKRKRLLEGIWCEMAEGAVFNFKRDVNHSDVELEYVGGRRTGAGWDFGIAADVAIIWLQIFSVPKSAKNPKGIIINIIDEYINNNQDYTHFANVAKSKLYRDVEHVGDPSGKSRDSKLESWFSNLASVGVNLDKPPHFTVADMISNVNDLMPYIRVNEIQCPHVVEMLENWSYPKDKDGKVIENSLPEHNVYSHPGTSLLYILTAMIPPQKSKSAVYFY